MVKLAFNESCEVWMTLYKAPITVQLKHVWNYLKKIKTVQHITGHLTEKGDNNCTVIKP